MVPVTVLGVAVQRSLAGDRHILGVDHIDERGKAVEGVALPQGQILLVLFVMAGENARQDRVVTAVGAAEQGAALLKIQGRVALQKETLGSVGACGYIDRTAGRAGGKRCLQLGGVVGHAVCHKAVTAGIDKKALLCGGEGERVGHAVQRHSEVIGMGRLKRIKRKYVRIPAADGGTVQRDGVGRRGAIAAVIDQLKHRAA